MKLHTAILERYIDLPFKEVHELHTLLDDVGLEVKDIEERQGNTVFTIETLANRGDHLYALGVARELSGRLLTKIKFPTVGELPERRQSIPVRRNTEKCSRYALLEMVLPTGMELREEIRLVLGAVDDRKHVIVDLLNYLPLELGEPMHAFDKDKIEGEIIIDLTSKTEEIAALDGKTYKVPPESIVIRDKKKIVAVAGIIGCANSMVTPGTARVLIEAAAFDPIAVRKTARSMGISTDASYTFERGSDPEIIPFALKRLIHLLNRPGAEGNVPQIVGLTYSEGDPIERRKIPLRFPAVRKQLNLPRLNEVEISTRLKNLGYGVEVSTDSKEALVLVPSWRLWDVFNEEDLIEDFVRSHGLNGVKQDLPALDYEIPEPNDTEKLLSKVEVPLLGAGFNEVITRVFYSQDDLRTLGGLHPGFEAEHITSRNSIESAYSHLRGTNLLHLVSLSVDAQKMGLQAFKVFEFCRYFSKAPHPGPYEYERDMLTFASSGRWFCHDWRKVETLDEQFYLFKGVVESVMASVGQDLMIGDGKHPFLHPGYQAAILSGRETIGHFGVIHPSIKKAKEIRSEFLFCELDATLLIKGWSEGEFTEPIDFPSIKRDLTLKIAPQNLAGKVIQWISQQKIDNLVKASIADDFRRADEEFRRVTYRLTFQNIGRTLSHDEVDASVSQILGVLREKHKLELAA